MIGPLLFLVYSTGDAFVLDIEDKFACELCVEGEKQRYPVRHTATKWVFNWPYRYSLAKNHIHIERLDGDSSGLPWMEDGAIKREIARYNRKAGTNYQL